MNVEMLGLTMLARFIPFSQSRNAKKKHPSLNWKITLRRNGRDILPEFDYMQGCAHAPAFSLFVKEAGNLNCILRDEYILEECETGTSRVFVGTKRLASIPIRAIPPPELKDVLYSLMLDASVIDYASFADWCSDFGYSDDSIKARAAYDEGIATALALRASLGNETFNELREAAQDW